MMELKTEETALMLKKFLQPHQILVQVPMKDHTSTRVGGTADILVLPSSKEEILKLKKFLYDSGIPHFIMGNGTNLIVADSGYHGVIIKLAGNFSEMIVKGKEIRVQAGALIASVAAQACKNALSGLEFASGIPGTAGGAVAMNAGAYGGEMKDVVTETECISEAAEEIVLRGMEHEFGYRSSRIQKEKLFVLEVKMKLEEAEPDCIREKMRLLNQRRRDKQPLDLPSAGSVFKRPEGFFAGKLIQDAGLRGYRIGGAQVSEKHCGFIVNTGNATADDVIRLIDHVRERVYQNSGILLETEVKILGG